MSYLKTVSDSGHVEKTKKMLHLNFLNISKRATFFRVGWSFNKDQSNKDQNKIQFPLQKKRI
jgi:hypothetical protein